MWLLSKNKNLVKGHNQCVLLPNPVEFKRLKSTENQTVDELAKELGVLIVEKGAKDTIALGSSVTHCDTKNSARRCGGQGDLLAGCMAVFMSWASNFIKSQDNMNDEKIRSIRLSAALGACSLARECNNRAFEKHHRGMTTVEMIQELPNAFFDLYESKMPKCDTDE